MAISVDEIAMNYPIPTYRFIVTLGEEHVPFTSVSGLDINYDTVEYSDGTGNKFIMPGQRQTPTITLSKGVFPGKNALYEWINSIQLNQIDKKDIMVSLTNDAGSEVLVSWNITNAFPTSLTSPSFDATSNEIAVQQVTLTADRVTIQTA